MNYIFISVSDTNGSFMINSSNSLFIHDYIANLLFNYLYLKFKPNWYDIYMYVSQHYLSASVIDNI